MRKTKRVVSRSRQRVGITSRNERCLLPLRPCLSVYAQRFFSFNDTWSIKKTKLFQPYFLFFSLSLFSSFSFVHFLDLWFRFVRYNGQVVSLLHNLSRRSFRHWFFTRNLASRDRTRRETRSQEREKVNHDLTRSPSVVTCPSLPFLPSFFSFYPRCLLAPRKQRKCFHAAKKISRKRARGKRNLSL